MSLPKYTTEELEERAEFRRQRDQVMERQEAEEKRLWEEAAWVIDYVTEASRYEWKRGAVVETRHFFNFEGREIAYFCPDFKDVLLGYGHEYIQVLNTPRQWCPTLLSLSCYDDRKGSKRKLIEKIEEKS